MGFRELMKVGSRAQGNWDKQENSQQQLVRIHTVDLAQERLANGSALLLSVTLSDGLNIGIDDSSDILGSSVGERLACHWVVPGLIPGRPFFSLPTLNEVHLYSTGSFRTDPAILTF